MLMKPAPRGPARRARRRSAGGAPSPSGSAHPAVHDRERERSCRATRADPHRRQPRRLRARGRRSAAGSSGSTSSTATCASSRTRMRRCAWRRGCCSAYCSSARSRASWRGPSAATSRCQVLRPLIDVTHALQRFATRDFTPQPIAVAGKSEFDAIALAYNAAAAQVVERVRGTAAGRDADAPVRRRRRSRAAHAAHDRAGLHRPAAPQGRRGRRALAPHLLGDIDRGRADAHADRQPRAAGAHGRRRRAPAASRSTCARCSSRSSTRASCSQPGLDDRARLRGGRDGDRRPERDPRSDRERRRQRDQVRAGDARFASRPRRPTAGSR